MDDAEVGDEDVLTGVLAIGEEAGAHIAHDVARCLVEVPLREHLYERCGVVAVHGDRLAEVAVHVLLFLLRCATARRWFSDMPSRSKRPLDPLSMAPDDFGGMPSRSRISVIGRSASS